MSPLPHHQYILGVRLERSGVENFNEYPFSIPAIKHLERLDFHQSVTFLVGENGMGKSTLIEGLATKLGFNPEGGSRNFRFETKASHSVLYKHLIIERGIKKPKDGYYLRAESFYNLASEIEQLDAIPSNAPPIINSYGGRSLHDQSHGESFFSLLLNRLKGNGIYIFDEPEAALSPSRQMSMLTLIHQLVAKKSQFIIATHSPILMAYPHAKIYLASDQGLRQIAYTDTEHFRVTRDFLNRHQTMLDILLNDLT